MGQDLSIEKKDITVSCITWNLGNNYPRHGIGHYLKEKTDIIAFGVQEANFDFDKEKFSSLDEALYQLIHEAAGPADYDVVFKQSCTPRTERKMTKEEFLLAFRQKSPDVDMSGIRLIVLAKKSLSKQNWGVTDVEPLVQNCGRAKGLSGNKGGVAISFRIHGTVISFQNSHLPAHAECLAERVWGFQKVTAGLHDPKGDFEEPPTYGSMSMENDTFTADYCSVVELSNRSHIFVQMGDFNFRLEKECENVKKSLATKHAIIASNAATVLAHVAKSDWSAMKDYDQLRREIDRGRAFFGFQEHAGHPHFRPTFKFDQNSKRNAEPGNNTEYSTKRCPSWCDRVLYKATPGTKVESHKYIAFHDYIPNTSDHAAVAAYFTFEVIRPSVKKKKMIEVTISDLTFTPDEKAICDLFERTEIPDFELDAKPTSKVDVVQRTKLYVSIYHPAFAKLKTPVQDYATAGVTWPGKLTVKSSDAAKVLSYPLMFGVRNDEDQTHKGHRMGENSLSTVHMWNNINNGESKFSMVLMQRGAQRGTLSLTVEVNVSKG